MPSESLALSAPGRHARRRSGAPTLEKNIAAPGLEPKAAKEGHGRARSTA